MQTPTRSGAGSRAQSPNGTLRSASPIQRSSSPTHSTTSPPHSHRGGGHHDALYSTHNSSSFGGTTTTNSSALHTRKLSAEELAKLNDRISKPKEDPSTKLAPLHKPHLVPKSQLDTSIERMYKQAVDSKNRGISNARQRRDEAEAPKSVKISPDELDESVRRLYNQSVERKHKNHEKLSDRYLFKLPPISQTLEEARAMGSLKSRSSKGSRSTSRPSSPDATHLPPSRAELVSRLYTKELSEIEKRKEERYQKYVASTEPKMIKAAESEIVEIVDRLYNAKK